MLTPRLVLLPVGFVTTWADGTARGDSLFAFYQLTPLRGGRRLSQARPRSFLDGMDQGSWSELSQIDHWGGGWRYPWWPGPCRLIEIDWRGQGWRGAGGPRGDVRLLQIHLQQKEDIDHMFKMQ